MRTCGQCGEVLHRVPQTFIVNWNGLPPHLADARPPQIAKYVNDAPEIVARTKDAKAKRMELEHEQKAQAKHNHAH